MASKGYNNVAEIYLKECHAWGSECAQWWLEKFLVKGVHALQMCCVVNPFSERGWNAIN